MDSPSRAAMRRCFRRFSRLTPKRVRAVPTARSGTASKGRERTKYTSPYPSAPAIAIAKGHAYHGRGGATYFGIWRDGVFTTARGLYRRRATLREALFYISGEVFIPAQRSHIDLHVLPELFHDRQIEQNLVERV